MADDAPKVKEDQSRQQATYGAAAMAMLKKTHVIVSGMNGLGAEIAKNTILASVKSVTLHDTKEAVISDLGAHFYLTESDVGTNRAEACLPQLQELNPNVGVRAASGSLLDVLAAGVPAQGSAPAAAFSICVAIDLGGAEAQAVNEFCRTQETPIKFIRTDARGLFGQLFCDFGDEFTVFDATGEQAKHAILASVHLSAEETRCECLFDDEGRHHLEDYDTVRFTEIRGATELNEGTFQVKVVNPYSFTLGSKDDEGNWVPLDSSSFGAYEGGGIMTQVKQPVVLNFKSLAEANVSPGMFLESDFSKWGASGLNHVLFQALDKFIDAHDGALPQPCNADDAAEIILLAKEVSATLENPIEEIDEAKATKFAHGASAVLNPMAAIFGGIAGQEVVKAATGKYHPCHQYFLYDALECLPDDDLPASEFALEGTRYDANITVFGKSWQEKVVQQKWFLVGAGALGCEFLKNFCLMGVGCSAEGLVTVTDDDIIELSNLTRQFLFRNWHVGSNKSTTAAEAAQAMNPAFNIVARADRVSPNTESTFNDEFWGSLDGVCNALDNVKARLYVDNKCVFYGKPLLESGTLGTKCNVQVVKPHDTEHYGASVDPPEKEAPQCTVHNFPHNIDHCLVWARSEFVGNFETVPTETAKYIEKGAAYLTDLREANAAQGDIEENIRGDKLWGGGILGMLVEDQTNDWASCVAWARNAFEKYSRNMILQLTTSFPRDAKTNKGTDFWVAPKRFPEPLPFDDQDDMTMQFITAAACLRAKVNGVALPAAFDDWSNTPEQRDTVFAFMRGEMSGVEVPEFVPNTNVKIKTDEDGDDDGDDDDAAASNAPVDIDAVFASLPSGDALAGVTVTPEEFEKDDETNFHMDFIHALANLRARNYEITEIDQLEARLKAGRIIPAIATTTAMVTGFVMLEFCKLINDRPIEAFRNSFANLALPLFAISEPMPPRKAESRTEKNVPDPINHPEYVEEEEITAYPEGHTIWDSIECRPPNGDFTVQEFKDWWQAEHGLTLSSMTIGVALIYADYLGAHRERLDKTLISLVNDVAGVQIEDHVNCLMPVCALRDADGKDVDLARVVYYFR